jgi:hypothetical protein
MAWNIPAVRVHSWKQTGNYTRCQIERMRKQRVLGKPTPSGCGCQCAPSRVQSRSAYYDTVLVETFTPALATASDSRYKRTETCILVSDWLFFFSHRSGCLSQIEPSATVMVFLRCQSRIWVKYPGTCCKLRTSRKSHVPSCLQVDFFALSESVQRRAKCQECARLGTTEDMQGQAATAAVMGGEGGIVQ